MNLYFFPCLEFGVCSHPKKIILKLRKRILRWGVNRSFELLNTTPLSGISSEFKNWGLATMSKIISTDLDNSLLGQLI